MLFHLLLKVGTGIAYNRGVKGIIKAEKDKNAIKRQNSIGGVRKYADKAIGRQDLGKAA